MLSLFSASLDRTEDWRTEAASTPSKTLQRPGPGRWLRSTICARWTRFSHVIWFLPVWCCKNLIWLRSRPQVVGDGNFAVVRVCYSRLTRKEFAVKIIDKVRAYSHHQHSSFYNFCHSSFLHCLDAWVWHKWAFQMIDKLRAGIHWKHFFYFSIFTKVIHSPWCRRNVKGKSTWSRVRSPSWPQSTIPTSSSWRRSLTSLARNISSWSMFR